MNTPLLKINTLLILIMLAGASLVSSCSKGSDDINYAALTFIHASPGLPPIDIYVDGSRTNGNRIIAYTDTIPYKFISTGSHLIAVNKNISSIIYISKNFDFDPESYYSMFITGKHDSVTYVMTRDNMTAPADGKAKLRFLNLSPDAPPLDFRISSSSGLFAGLAFKSYSEFTQVEPGEYTMGIYEQGNPEPLAEENITIDKGVFYTIWAKGLLASQDEETKLGLQTVAIEQ